MIFARPSFCVDFSEMHEKSPPIGGRVCKDSTGDFTNSHLGINSLGLGLELVKNLQAIYLVPKVFRIEYLTLLCQKRKGQNILLAPKAASDITL